MKLLMISGDRSILQGKRGAFWYTLEEMSKHWERIDVICPRPALSFESRVLRTGKIFPSAHRSQLIAHSFFDHVFLHPSPRGLWYQPWWILQQGSALLGTHHHDVMTVHAYPPFYNDIGAAWLYHSAVIPFVLEVHHIVGYPIAASLAEHIGYWLSRFHLPRIAHCAGSVRCVSRGTAELLRSWGAQRVEVVPSFYLDRTALQPDPSIAKQYDIVACARLVANKGMEELVAAVASMPEATVLIVGDGPLRSALESQVQRFDLQQRVTFAGWLGENTDVYRALQSGSVFVVNSKSEGGPRVALEAMALGLPIVATRVGVMPEVLEEGGNGLFTTGEPEDLAVKIRQLLRDGALRQRLGSEARKILDRFGRQVLVRQYAEFLKSSARAV